MLVQHAVDANPTERARTAAASLSNEGKRALLQHPPFLAAVGRIGDEKQFDFVRDVLGAKGSLALAMKKFRSDCGRARKKLDVELRGGPAPLAGSSHVDIGKAYLEERGDLVAAYDGAVHVYDSGVWVRSADEDEHGWIMSNLHERHVLQDDRDPYPLRLNKGHVEGGLFAAKTLGAKVWRQHVPALRPVGVAFRNGFLELVESDDPVLGTRVELSATSPRNGATSRHEFDYAPDAEAPQFDRFLADLFKGAPDAVDRVAALRQFAGAALFGIAPRYKRALFLDGDRDSGKSQFIMLLQAMMPKGTTTSVGLEAMADKHERATLASSLLNQVAELPNRDWMDSSWFKRIIAGDEVQARDLYKSPFTFRPRTAHVFATNGLPRVADKSEATTARMLVVRFDRKSVADPQYEWQAKAVVGIADRIVKTEMPGLVAWAVRGALELIRQGHYTTPLSGIDVVQELRAESDSVRQFVEERLDTSLDPGNGIRAGEMYARYQEWAESNGVRPCSAASFGKSLQRLVREALGMPQRARVAAKSNTTVYLHVRWSSGERIVDVRAGAVCSDAMLEGDSQQAVH